MTDIDGLTDATIALMGVGLVAGTAGYLLGSMQPKKYPKKKSNKNPDNWLNW